LDKFKPLASFHKEYAEAVGCPSSASDFNRVLECLQSAPLAAFYEHSQMFDDCNLVNGGKKDGNSSQSYMRHKLWPGLMAFPAPWKPTDDSAYSKDPFFSSGKPQSVAEKGQVSFKCYGKIN